MLVELRCHWYVTGPPVTDEFSTTLPPAQNVVAPAADIVAEASEPAVTEIVFEVTVPQLFVVCKL
jgi:hypothetical protein